MSTACWEQELAILDYEALVGRCVGNVEFAERVLCKFLDRFGEDLGQLEDEWERQNSAEIARLAHRIKGASASVSAIELSRQAADLERLGREHRLSEIPSSLRQLEEAWCRFVSAVEEFVSGENPPG